MHTTKPLTIDEYIAGCPPGVQDVLKKIRTTIKKAAPDAAETINYQIPTYTLNGNLVHFAAFKNQKRKDKSAYQGFRRKRPDSLLAHGRYGNSNSRFLFEREN